MSGTNYLKLPDLHVYGYLQCLMLPLTSQTYFVGLDLTLCAFPDHWVAQPFPRELAQMNDEDDNDDKIVSPRQGTPSSQVWGLLLASA